MNDIEELVEFALQLIATETGSSLNYIQKVMLRDSLPANKKTYARLAEENKYSESYIKFTIAPKLWLLLSQALGEKVNKTNLLALLEQRLEQFASVDNPQTIETATARATASLTREHNVLESPEGQVPLASFLYIERSPIEQICYQDILPPCAFIRIKASRKMGKTSLI